MRINVIDAPSTGAIDYLIYPDMNHNTQRFLYEQVNKINTSLTEAGRSFMEGAKEIYNKINDSNLVRMAKAAVRMAKGSMHPNMIYDVKTLDDLQGAQPVMQRYLMAEPTIRNLYHQQLCDGYADTYIDMHPGCIGENHYDWRRVMTGVPVDVKNGEDDETYFKFYMDDVRGDDIDLSHEEKVSVLNAWDIMKIFIEKGNDPTSIFNDKLGTV